MATTFKVATLVIKTLVKPIANQLKKNAVHEGWFRDSCHWAGQVSNTILTHVQLRSMGHKVKKIKPMPTDDAVKAGADLFAEGMVLSTGMVVIGIEVVRKARADAAAAEKKIHDDIILKEKKELKLLEKERSLREQLIRLETRMMEVENAKFATLHEKLLHEQQKHLLVTENLLKRLHYLENQLKITTPYPLLPSHRPPSHPSNQPSSSPPSSSPVVQAAANTLATVDQQPQNTLYQSMREQTNKLFSYSSFFQSEPATAVTAPSSSSSTPQLSSEDEMMLAEEDLVHHLLDTTLPTICSVTSAETCGVDLVQAAHHAAELVIEASILPEEEVEFLDSNAAQQLDVSDQLVELDRLVGNVADDAVAAPAVVQPTSAVPADKKNNIDEYFPIIKPLKQQPHAAKLVDELPEPQPVPSSKQHLSVALKHKA